jgi:hypothetical protein
MKKLNLWLLASLFVAAFTLSACGSDDGDTVGTTGNPTSVVGKWHASVPSWGDGLCSRYNHEITFEFKSNKTFEAQSSWSGGGEEGPLFRFTGTYTDANATITLNISKTEFYQGNQFVQQDMFYNWDVYDPNTKTWSFDWETDIDPSAIALPYSLSGTKLQLGNPNKHLVFHNHGLLTATFDWQGN